MEDENCDQWVEVDFGHGPVEVRCTRKGDHKNHETYVVMEDSVGHAEDVVHKNVFDKKE